jgi:hypothetical protein
MMRTRTYYRAALLFPLLLPIILAAAVALQRGLGRGIVVLGDAFAQLGAAYVALLVGLFGWSHGRGGRDLQKAARLAPLFFTGILAVQQVFARITAPHSLLAGASVIDTVAGTLLIGLVFGYLFVLVAEAIFGVLDEAGLIDRSQDVSGA